MNTIAQACIVALWLYIYTIIDRGKFCLFYQLCSVENVSIEISNPSILRTCSAFCNNDFNIVFLNPVPTALCFAKL